MEVVASAFAVLSLAIQVLDTVEKTRGFVRDIQDAPKELVELSGTLNQLGLVLEDVKILLQARSPNPHLPDPPIALPQALKECERRTQPLQDIVQAAERKMSQGGRVQKSWASLKLVTKKEQLRDLQTQLRDAKLDLSTALSVDQSQLQ